MKHLSLKDLILSPEESKDIVEFVLKVSENKNKTRIEKIREEIKKLLYSISFLDRN